MNETISISVIIPVYNVEGYIGRCIESLKAQTLDGLEFIFVDDCSTDNSMEAVEAWATQDERARILRNEQNIGAGPSRNRGIEVARGEYLSFVDPDDYVSLDFYELLYQTAMAHAGHDIAKGSTRRVGPLRFDKFSSSPLNSRIRKSIKEKRPLYTSFTYDHQSAIYRRGLFANPDVCYGASRTGEDITFLLRCCYQTEDIVFEERATYFYVQREGSIYERGGIERIDNEIDKLHEMAEFLIPQTLDDASKSYLLGQAENVLSAKMIPLLGKGKLTPEEFNAGIERLVAFVYEISDLADYGVCTCENSVSQWPRLRRLLAKDSLITPEFRYPWEGNIRISVVLPVYNPGEGIHKCIESLRSQPVDGLEFIFVDDCSTDDSIAAVEAWAAQDERVRILRNEENLGPGPSRNHGIDAARGDYLSFVDPDDYISPDFYELLYAAAIADGGHDIAKGSVRKVDEDTNAIGSIESKQNERIKNRDKKGMPLFRVFTYEHWTALYRASLFSDGTARYGTSGKDQDTTFQLSICLKTEDLVLAEEATYYYVQRSGSIVHSTSVQRFFDELDALEEKVAILNARGIDDDAVRYLAVKLKVHRCNYETAIEGNPELQAAASSYYQRMDGILESIPNAGSYRVIQDARWGNLAGGDSLTNPLVSVLSKLKRRLRSAAHSIKRRLINNA